MKKSMGLKRGKPGKQKTRHHKEKHNALCTLTGIERWENFITARKAERKKASSLKSETLKEKVRLYCDNDSQEHWEELKKKISSKGYTPQPIRVHRIPKDNGKEREIFIRDNPMDRVIERMIYLQIAPILEETLSNAAYAYRPGIGMAQMIHAIRKSGEEGFNYCIKADMSKFFNTVDQTILKEELKKVLHPDNGAAALLNKFITARCCDSRTGSVYTLNTGVAQGGTLAPLLANFYCNPLDRVMESVSSIRYFRYADDILIIGKDVQEPEEAYSTMIEELGKLKLKINGEKLEKGPLTGTEILGIRFAENYSLSIPEKRLRQKIAALNTETDSEKRISKWIGLLKHYQKIDAAILDDEKIDSIIREECSQETVKELMTVFNRIRGCAYMVLQGNGMNSLSGRDSPVTHGTHVPYETGDMGFADRRCAQPLSGRSDFGQSLLFPGE